MSLSNVLLHERRIHHQVFGYGEILGTRRGGREYLISFDNSSLRMWLSASEIALIGTQGLDSMDGEVDIGEGLELLFSDLDRQTQTTNEVLFDDQKYVSARKMIEAFRLGVVPYNEIEDFTFHRDIERQKIFSTLNTVQNHGGIIKMVRGEYGTGKSHFLESIKHLALADGWVVASTEFDQFEIKPQNPKSVYRALLLSLHTNQRGHKKLIKLISEAIINPSIFKKIQELKHPYLTRLFEVLRFSKSYNEQILWQWFTGDTINIPYVRRYCKERNLPSLLPYYSTAPIVCNILGGLSVIFKMMGYKGLLLLFDEAESIANVPNYYKKKAHNFFSGLKLATLGTQRSGLQNARLAHPSRGVDLNYVFSEHSYLASVFAMTPRPDDSTTILEKLFLDEWKIDLNPLERENFVDLVDKLIDIYRIAYPTDRSLSQEQKEQIISFVFNQKESDLPTIRLMIKSVIEVLDLINFYPNADVETLLEREDDFSLLFSEK